MSYSWTGSDWAFEETPNTFYYDCCGGRTHEDHCAHSQFEGCQNETVCVGCLHTCSNCGLNICSEHLVEIPTSGDYRGTHLCTSCALDRNQDVLPQNTDHEWETIRNFTDLVPKMPELAAERVGGDVGDS